MVIRSNGNTAYYSGYVTQPPFVDESPKSKWSGLYDADGVALYRQPNPIGFETHPSRKIK